MSLEQAQTDVMVKLIPLSTCACVTQSIVPNDQGFQVKVAYTTSIESACRMGSCDSCGKPIPGALKDLVSGSSHDSVA